MRRPIESHTSTRPVRVAARIALVYAAFGAAWILASDYALVSIVSDISRATHYASLKGCAFILVTALLVFQMVKAYASAADASRRELQRSEQSYRRIVETANEGIAVLDVAGRLTLINSRLATLLGRSPEELLGQTFLDLAAPESRQVLTEQLHPRACCPSRGCDICLRDHAGHEVSVIAAVSPLNEGGRHLGSLVMLTDISERKRLESQLLQLQKMEALGQLAGGVAHDFNNIITAILGNADLLRLHLKHQPPSLEAATGDLEQIERAGERAVGLTRQLLTFSRRQVVKLELVDLGRLLPDMARMLSRLIREDIELNVTPAAVSWTVQADAGQLEQVVVNLVVNARDAMPEGGRLTIETSNVTLDANYAATHPEAQPGDHVVLAVSDTGIGMDAETSLHIFEPFFTTKPAEKGTGLGLSTVYGIIKQFHGHITVYSEPGMGTTFKVYLPASRQASTAQAAGAPSAELRGGTESILVCEDDRPIRDLIHRILSQWGYQIIAVQGPQEAIDSTRQRGTPIHLLITDVIMAGMDGRQLARQMAAEQPGIKVLYISGYTSDVIAHHGVLDPGVQLLQKPFTAEELVQRVRQVLDT